MQELTAAGIPTVTDPDLLLPNLADMPICALISPPNATAYGVSGEVDLDIPVSLAYRPPGGYIELVPALEALPAILYITGGEARSTRLSIADHVFPAYAFVATQHVEIPR